MRELIEVRISEERAARFLEPGLGKRLGETTRQVILPMEDPHVQLIGKLNREIYKRGGVFFTFWDIRRHYTSKELSSAELLHLLIRSTFEPPGELCGTRYDDTTACPYCGAGAPQETDLYLDVRRIPKKRDLAITIAGEVVVSTRLAEALGLKSKRTPGPPGLGYGP
jgi:hypothetical protein